MSESAHKRQRLSSDDGTHSDPRHLTDMAQKPTTPFRRVASAGPASTSRLSPSISARTPGTAARTPRALLVRDASVRRAAPTTPHAIRALRERANAARTPGRRRSGRLQRETPRDTLRALSRTLARNSRPTEPSPQEARLARHAALDLPDIDDGADPVRPRFSIPLDDMYEDDSIHETAPRPSLLPEVPEDGDTATLHSVEFGRRAFSEDPRAGRVSDHFGDMTGLNIDGDEYTIDGTFIHRAGGDLEQPLGGDLVELEDTGEIRGLASGRAGLGEVDLDVFDEMDEMDEPTFRFTIPQRAHIRSREAQAASSEQSEGDAQVDSRQMEDDANAGAELGSGYGEDEHGSADKEATAHEPEVQDWESDHNSEDDFELQAYREEESAIDRSLLTESPNHLQVQASQRAGRQRKTLHVSKFGLEFPAFPTAVVKRIAAGLNKAQGRNAKINKETLAVLAQTTDWFFEQVSESAAAYAQHAGRKAIEEADLVMLMKRQRLITKSATIFSLAQKMLPRELLQDLRMQPIGKVKRQKRKRLERIAEEQDE